MGGRDLALKRAQTRLVHQRWADLRLQQRLPDLRNEALRAQMQNAAAFRQV